jgi:protein gp37
VAGWRRQNIWLGVTIENRRFVDRAELLRCTPAAVRFVSAEPLLGSLINDCAVCHGGGTCSYCDSAPGLDLAGIDWLIAGGESGPKHRPVKEEWLLELLDATGAPDSSTAFFFKQWGGAKPTSGGRELAGRTWSEFPATPDRKEAVR